ncbi:hypothetical protein [Xenorhabdus japonica]|uniref:Uncharacterized protein n=1 Tax=Xenorhabdus japonica TaxID=53341 RepID=A0A1I4YCY6_9GAMM|nr:hypothetical protein [Xenorhabdus japonica]SFN35836.1 hypothetical protein SAMN05421579_101174 [Xenorhabdus japonica]
MKDIHEIANIYAKNLASQKGQKVYSVETWNYSNTPKLAPYKSDQVRVEAHEDMQWEFYDVKEDEFKFTEYDWYNHTSEVIEKRLKYEKLQIESATWSVRSPIKVGIDFQLKVLFPFVSEDREKLSTSIKVGDNFSKTVTNTWRYQEDRMLEIKPHTHSWGYKHLLMKRGTAYWTQSCQYIGAAGILLLDGNKMRLHIVYLGEIFNRIKYDMHESSLLEGYKSTSRSDIILANVSGSLDYNYFIKLNEYAYEKPLDD